MHSDGPYRQRPRAARRLEPGETACPACAKAVRDDVRACPRCGAPIATVRCAECFHMNVVDAVLCTGCGHELGLEPVAEPATHDCPDCKLPLAVFRGEGGLLHDCGRCGGQFVDHGLVQALLERRERYGAALTIKPPKGNPLDSPVRYLPCPACRDIMTRKNFGTISGIIVDICRVHGMWFDPGELPRVLAFVEAGGLALAKQRATDVRSRTGRERDDERALAQLSEPRSPFDRAGSTVAMAEASSLLLDFVRGLLTGR